MCENSAWVCKSSTAHTAAKKTIKIFPTGFATLPTVNEDKSREPAGQPQQAQAPGLSAGSLCDLSDEQIAKFYITEAQFGIPENDRSEEICKLRAQEILGSLGSYKLGAAKCRADAALECAARKEAFSNCNQVRESPTKVAELVTEKLCRRVAPPPAIKPDNALYGVAEKWFDKDPAFADQLVDTAEKKSEEKKKLGALSYVFGDGDYGSKLKDRAAKLREVKDRLIAAGTSDAVTIASLEAQALDFEAEANRFSNTLDITRLGDFFSGAG